MSDTKNVEYALIVKTDTSYSCLPISLALSDIFSHIKPSYDSQNIHVAHVCITVLKKTTLMAENRKTRMYKNRYLKQFLSFRSFFVLSYSSTAI